MLGYTATHAGRSHEYRDIARPRTILQRFVDRLGDPVQYRFPARRTSGLFGNDLKPDQTRRMPSWFLSMAVVHALQVLG
jgi:hypothetical protein